MSKLLFIGLMLLVFPIEIQAQDFSAELQELREDYKQALSSSNTQNILQVYSEDAAIHHIDGRMLNGSQEIAAFYDSFFAINKASIDFKNISEDMIADDLVFYHDEVYLQVEGEGLEKIEVVNITKKINGKWRVIKSYRWPMPVSN